MLVEPHVQFLFSLSGFLDRVYNRCIAGDGQFLNQRNPRKLYSTRKGFPSTLGTNLQSCCHVEYSFCGNSTWKQLQDEHES
jgi:hypothetical protein